MTSQRLFSLKRLSLFFLLTAPMLTFTGTTQAAKWNDSFGNPGANGTVNAIAKDTSGNVYVGGDFTAINGVSANHIAKWDSSTSTWTALKISSGNDGTDGAVYAISIDSSNKVYVGGNFTYAAGKQVKNIAKWDGTNPEWYPLSKGVEGTVYTIAFGPSGTVYAGGEFTKIVSGAPVNHIAQWNGFTWSAVGSGVNGVVRALAFKNNILYAGGDFTKASGDHYSIAQWNGSSWSDMDGSLNPVYTLVLDNNGNLHAGGKSSSIYKSDGSSWSPLIIGSSNENVYTLAFDSKNNLYAGGEFTQFGGVLANNIVKWDNSKWSVLGSGMDKLVKAIQVDSKDNLYAGGAFTTAGGHSSNYIALWQESVPIYSSDPPVDSQMAIKTPIFTDHNQILKVINSGGENLEIGQITIASTITSDSEQFIVSPTQFTVSSKSFQDVTVTCQGKAVGTYTGILTVSHNDDSSNGSANYKLICTVVKADQTITFSSLPANPLVVGGNFTLSANGGGSSNPVTFSVTTDTCAVSGNKVYALSAGSCIIQANQAGDDNYNPAPSVSQTVTINDKASQTINFPPLSPKTYRDSDFAISATGGGSGNPVTFSATGTCNMVSENTVHITSAGSCIIKADQAGNNNYLAATSVSQTFMINKADQTIVFSPPLPPAKTLGDSNFAISATGGGSKNLVTFSVTGTCMLFETEDGNKNIVYTVSLVSSGSCNIKANQAGDSNYNPASVSQTFIIKDKAKADQTITFPPLPTRTFGDPDFTVSATASSGLPVTFSATGICNMVSGNTVHITGAGSCTIQASQNGDNNYNAAPPVSQTLTINKASQTINFPPLPTITFIKDYQFAINNVTSINNVTGRESGNPITFNATGTCTVSGNTVRIKGAGSCTIQAVQDGKDQAGNSNYNPASVSQPFTINKADQTIVFSPPLSPTKTYGDPDFTVRATTNYGLSATLNATGTCSIVSGNTVHITGAGSCTIKADGDGNDNYNPVSVTVLLPINKADQTINFPSLPTITFIEDHQFAINNVTSINNVTGRESGNPITFNATGTCTVSGNTVRIKGAGSCTIQAVQDGKDQAGNSNYNPASVSQPFTINKVDQSITFPSLSTKTYGDPDFTVSATASLPVTFSATGTCGMVSGNTVRITGAGSCTIQASQNGDNNYNAATPISQTFTILRSITVTKARIGCLDIQLDGNLTNFVAQACNRQISCSYKAPTEKEYKSMGVVAKTRSFCTQGMEIDYYCSPGENTVMVYVEGDAWDHDPAYLSCVAPIGGGGGGGGGRPKCPSYAPNCVEQ